MIATVHTPAAQPISPVDAIWAIIQSQSKDVRHALFLRFKAEQKQEPATADILRRLSELEPGPEGFLKLDSILPPSSLSAEELREDAYTEKYGICRRFSSTQTLSSTSSSIVSTGPRPRMWWHTSWRIAPKW